MRFRSLACLLVAGAALSAQALTPRFVSFPDVHGDGVVFTWEDDLWLGSLKGGEARRITTHPGVETSAHFSPDGKWIAFSARYDGTTEAYVMPAEGGAPRRLTWHGPVQVVGWTPDSRQVIFRADNEYNFRPVDRLYAVGLQGHEPEPLPLEKAVQGAFSPDGSKLAFSTKGIPDYYWKRYKGGWHQDLWIGDLKAKQFEPLTDYVGRNSYPMWAQGKVLFVSDRGATHLSNLYAVDPASKAVTALTDVKDFDVQQPSTDGQTVVFVQGGYLQALDLATHTVAKVPVTTVSDAWKVAPRIVNGRDWIQSMSLVGPTAVFEARGDVFLVPSDAQKPTVDLTRTPGVRERFPRLSPDGKRVAYFSDVSGDYDLYLQPAGGGAAECIPTGLKTALYHLEWSPDDTNSSSGTRASPSTSWTWPRSSSRRWTSPTN